MTEIESFNELVRRESEEFGISSEMASHRIETLIGNDGISAVELLAHRDSLKPTPPPPQENTTADWKIDGEALEMLIRAEQQATGLNYGDASRRVQGQIKNDVRRLAAASPRTLQKINEAQSAAHEAVLRAQAMMEERRQLIETLQELLISLGRTRVKIQHLAMFTISAQEEKSKAESILESALILQADPSPANRSKYIADITEFVYRKTMGSHVPEFASKLESQAQGIESEIKSLAAEHNVSVPALLVEMQNESTGKILDCPVRWPQFFSYLNADAFRALK